MKFTLEVRKPRNPHAVAARSRQAGVHGPSPKAKRQADRMALQRELSRESDHRRSP